MLGHVQHVLSGSWALCNLWDHGGWKLQCWVAARWEHILFGHMAGEGKNQRAKCFYLHVRWVLSIHCPSAEAATGLSPTSMPAEDGSPSVPTQSGAGVSTKPNSRAASGTKSSVTPLILLLQSQSKCLKVKIGVKSDDLGLFTLTIWNSVCLFANRNNKIYLKGGYEDCRR